MTNRRHDKRLPRNPLWYKDAVIYELHVRAFADSNGDGIGDFEGLISKLDYLQELGVTAIWLLPFYPSPLRDDGYDIADYKSVNPAYGTLADFRKFLREAHKRDLRVITELVINHTSNEHPWFRRARKAPAGSPHRDFYVWSETQERYRDARIIFQDFESSNWTWDPVAKAYFWHRFYSHQPDLNFDNPKVHEALFEVVDFWMGMGVDGMRLDAVPYLFEREGTNCENLPETHVFLKKLRAHVDGKFQDRMLLAEANQWPEDAAAYFGDGDECHMNFHFPLMPRMFMALHLEDRFPIVDILAQTPNAPESCQWATFLRNHDELTLEMVTDEDRDYMWRVYAEDVQARINLGIRRRLAPLLRSRPKVELLYSLLFSLPGTPVLYYGDEIGMGDNIYLGDRDGVRTPMQWSADRNAGFSDANPQRLFLPVIWDSEYHYETLNVETELTNPMSLLWWMKRLIGLATRHKAFGRGSFTALHPSNKKVLAFVRSHEEESILVVANLSRHSQHVELPLREFSGLVPEELFGRNRFPAIREEPYPLSLGPHGFFWFELTKPAVEKSTAVDVPDLGVLEEASNLATGALGERLENALVPFLSRQRWFRSKTRRARSASIIDDFPLSEDSIILLVEVDFYDGPQEVYLVPLALSEGVEAQEILEDHASSVVATVRRPSEPQDSGGAVLFDAAFSKVFAVDLLTALTTRRSMRGRKGRLTTWARRRRGAGAGAEQIESRVVGAEQSNTSIIYNDESILKLQRMVESGINSDVEIVRFLNERTSYRNAPELLGTIEYTPPNRAKATLGTLQTFIPNRGDAWRLMLDALDAYFEHIPALSASGDPERAAGPLVERAENAPPDVVAEALGPCLPLAHLLGKRTAELHVALGSDRRDPAFAPEPFSELYQHSLYQSARSGFLRTMDNLRATLERLPEEDRDTARRLAERSHIVDERLRRITSRKLGAVRIRCHGDYHLGQVLYTGKDFILIDFEGEPARALSERRLKRSPLQDVSGMLRSFHYAAVSAFRTRQETDTEIAKLKPWAHAWADWMSSLFLGEYLKTAQRSSVIPQSKDDIEDLLRFNLLAKCIYELGYELNNRPGWVSIPLAGFEELLQDTKVPV